MPLKSKNTVIITFTFDRTCRAFFGLGEPECLHSDDWDLVSTSFHTLCYTLFHSLRKIWYKFFDLFLLTNKNRRAHKNTSNLSGCHRQSKQRIQLKILSYFRSMYTNIIKKNFDNRTLRTREIKKFPLFSEHTSYFMATHFLDYGFQIGFHFKVLNYNNFNIASCHDTLRYVMTRIWMVFFNLFRIEMKYRYGCAFEYNFCLPKKNSQHFISIAFESFQWNAAALKHIQRGLVPVHPNENAP